ncbi:hypothetical protein [Clostridium intestinale]|jgi:hypothetical protein|uniref:Immunity protein 30 domain-containing protein n=1 Tax=Clostridium intestinale TaxID=36845 RepID=A0A7D6ZJR6_9CLOT|nr:hypothetical protein [Clostridium intestinale]QLY81799.1 hypothetical protein HZF06_09505 [Clostridium intestinale]
MESDIENIVNKIMNFKPRNDDWFELEEILEELYNSNRAVLGLEAMLRIYERYPDEDNDILWGMLHGIEGIENYEVKVIESIARTPSFFGILMINRMLNAKIYSIENMNLIDILKSVVDNPSATNYVKETANHFISI